MSSREARLAQDPGAKFDAYADDYARLHQRSISASGEAPEYFAEYKLRCIERLVGPGFDAPVLDFGCGTGSLLRGLANRYKNVSGYDPSSESLRLARQGAPGAALHDDAATVPESSFGLVVLAGVLHHVVPAERAGLVTTAVSKLRPGGRLVVFEHNPWNPLTRRAVKDCPFDDDAILLRAGEIARLLSGAGLGGVRRRFIVFFPRMLAWLRPLERKMGLLPVGAQIMAVGTRF